MLAIQLETAFSLANLHCRDLPKPSPGPREVLLEMRAASLNYRDLMIVRGEYNPRQPLPLVIGSDGVGVVVSLGTEATGFALGDRVSSGVAARWHSGMLATRTMKETLGGPRPGVLQGFMTANVDELVRVPAYLTDVEAATLPCAGLTAWRALSTLETAGDPQHVLIQGTGGVALFALQFAKLRGARVVVVSGSRSKLERLRTLGADHVIDRQAEPHWGRAVREWTGGEGVEIVVEVGGAGTLGESLLAVRPGGRIAVIGVLGGAVAAVDLRRLLMRNVSLGGVFLGSRHSFEAMNRALTSAELRPIIDRVFPVTKTVEALEYLASGAHFGKVCLAWNDSGGTES